MYGTEGGADNNSKMLQEKSGDLCRASSVLGHREVNLKENIEKIINEKTTNTQQRCPVSEVLCVITGSSLKRQVFE